MLIKYKDIIIRNVERKDCLQLAKWWNDGKVMAHCGFPNGLGISEKQIIEKIKTDTDETIRRMVIEYQNKLIGECSYDREDDLADIGIKICDFAYQEKGLGRVILSMMIERLFTDGVKKIVLDTDIDNQRARHVYELLGFKKIRVDMNSWTNQLGESRSSVHYELISSDFVNYK